LLINQGDGTFQEHALARGPGDFGSMGVTTGDIDNDGNIDLCVANMYSKAGTWILGNLGPLTYPADVMASMRSFVSGSQLHRNCGNLEFEQLGRRYQVAGVGWAYGPALVDLDNDGWLDLYQPGRRPSHPHRRGSGTRRWRSHRRSRAAARRSSQ
jgi:enediyne biosynthesis protein E4